MLNDLRYAVRMLLHARMPSTTIVAMMVMLATSALAGFVPARRALRVDPMVALHDE